MLQAPKIDRRTSHEIARDVRTFLPVYVENWSDLHGGGELADALIHVFARFGEFIVDRLNKTPEKNFLAFLDLLGVSPLPLQAARAPVTFYLAAGATGHALIPAGTQIAAPPGKGEQDPVIFETEKELVVVSVATVRPWRMYGPRRGGRTIIEAQSGAFERWGLRVGDQLELQG